MSISSGCWDQKIYEKTGFILQVGLEPGPSGKFRASYLLPVVDPDAKDESELFYNDVNLLREFREKTRKASSQVVEAAKLQQIVISDTLAYKGGVNDLLEIIQRDPNIPPICYVIIAEGSVIEMSEAARQFVDKPTRPALYIHRLIENNMESSYVPEPRIFEFTSKYFSPGIDPITPIIKLRLRGGKGIEVTGTALFRGDRMAGKIDIEKTPFLMAMIGEMKHTTFVSRSVVYNNSDNEKKFVIFALNKVKRELSVKIINDKPVVNIDLNFKGSIGEYRWNQKYDEEIQKSIEDKAAAEIKENCEWILKYTQEVGSDPIGIGDIVRAKYDKYWGKVKWEDTYKNVVFKVNVKFNIKNHGVIQ